MRKSGISARELHAHSADERANSEGRCLSDADARVLRKLDRAKCRSELRRTYERTGTRMALADVISDGDLVRHGYIPRDNQSVAIGKNDSVHRDRITCWSSESNGVTELWVGERL